MKQFIEKCFLYLVITLLFIAAGLLSLLQIVDNRIFRLGDSNIVFLGNSHFQTGIDDSIVKFSTNFSNWGETPLHFYLKLKLLHKHNQGLETAIVCFDNEILYHNTLRWDRFLPSYFTQYSLEDILMLYQYSTREEFCQLLSHPFYISKLQTYLDAALNQDYDIHYNSDMGGFFLFDHKMNSSEIESYSNREKIVHTDKDIHPLSLFFLRKIKEYCLENNLNLVFLCPPQHPLNDKDFLHFAVIAEREFGDVPFYNFISYPLPDSCFADMGHLNKYGAWKFSQFLDDTLFHRNEKTMRRFDKSSI